MPIAKRISENGVISKNDFRQAVLESIKQIKHSDSIDLGNDEEFSVAGLDSLDGMDLVLLVESKTGIDFGEFDLATANTIDKFYAKAQERAG